MNFSASFTDGLTARLEAAKSYGQILDEAVYRIV